MSKAEADQLWAQGILEHLRAREHDPQSCTGLSTFEAAIQADSSDALRHLYVATLRVMSGRPSAAEESYKAAMVADPGCGHSYLEYVLFLESQGRRDEARAVAADAIRAGARWSNEWQRPPIFTKGLTSRPYWGREDFPWAEDLEASFPKIQAELSELLAAKGSTSRDAMPKKFLKVGEERAAQDGDIVAPGGEWREFVIVSAQDPSEAEKQDIQRYLPETCKTLEEILPGAVLMAKMGVGEIIFSVLAPRTKLVPHCASSNARLTCHLGMHCPHGAKLRVGSEWSGWEEGKCIFFDDSFEHEVVHEGSEPRIVLLIRFWHPELNEERRVPALNEGMEEYSAMMNRRSSPPVSDGVAAILAPELQRIRDNQESEQSVSSMAAVLESDAPDMAVRCSENNQGGLLDVKDELF
eukprot:TRINITY_DN112472_c0_g1_i1.p1 TRINITY_DN112472_c0_g1~~TRINITY_DN112472_c0_g1_i1.p1  ORF type:complete len:422 (+),score=88.56 TRINITY_DN112472_c0_g1_i1:34-1266(+)